MPATAATVAQRAPARARLLEPLGRRPGQREGHEPEARDRVDRPAGERQGEGGRRVGHPGRAQPALPPPELDQQRDVERAERDVAGDRGPGRAHAPVHQVAPAGRELGRRRGEQADHRAAAVPGALGREGQGRRPARGPHPGEEAGERRDARQDRDRRPPEAGAVEPVAAARRVPERQQADEQRDQDARRARQGRPGRGEARQREPPPHGGERRGGREGQGQALGVGQRDRDRRRGQRDGPGRQRGSALAQPGAGEGVQREQRAEESEVARDDDRPRRG